jgi:hypothetical protein
MLRARGLKRTGPAAVGFDDFVDLGHQADGFAEGEDDLVVVGDGGQSRILADEFQSVGEKIHIRFILLVSIIPSPPLCHTARSALAPHGFQDPCSAARHPRNGGRRTPPDSSVRY